MKIFYAHPDILEEFDEDVPRPSGLRFDYVVIMESQYGTMSALEYLRDKYKNEGNEGYGYGLINIDVIGRSKIAVNEEDMSYLALIDSK